MSFHGDNLTQLRDERSWDPRTGWTIRRPWRGSPTAIDIQINALVAAGIKCDHIASDHADYETVIAYYGAESTQDPLLELADKWELAVNDIEKDLWTHPTIVGILDELLPDDGFPDDQYTQIVAEIRDLASGDKLPSEVTWWAGASTDTKKFVSSLMRGVNSFTVSEFVVRNTKIVASNYTPRLPYTRTNKMIPQANFGTIYPLPAVVMFNLPSNGYFLEKAPSVEQIAQDKFSMVREWWWTESFDPFLYSVVTS